MGSEGKSSSASEDETLSLRSGCRLLRLTFSASTLKISVLFCCFATDSQYSGDCLFETGDELADHLLITKTIVTMTPPKP